MKKTEVWSDGATIRTNPGLLTWGVCAEGDGWTIRFCGRSGFGTSCEAELLGIYHATLFLKNLKIFGATLHTDSNYCLNVISGAYNPQKHRTLVFAIRRLVKYTKTELKKIRGPFNKAHDPSQACKD